jgi:hypothetical protein
LEVGFDTESVNALCVFLLESGCKGGLQSSLFAACQLGLSQLTNVNDTACLGKLAVFNPCVVFSG